MYEKVFSRILLQFLGVISQDINTLWRFNADLRLIAINSHHNHFYIFANGEGFTTLAIIKFMTGFHLR